jgi:uncharacterized protein YigE (DUF2233 family)
MHARTSPGKIVAASLIASAACAALAVIAAVLSWPRLLVPLFGLNRQGSIASALPSDLPPLPVGDRPLSGLAEVEFLLPPYVRAPVVVAASELGGASFAGESDEPGVSNYLLVLDTVAINSFADRFLHSQDAGRTSYRDVWIAPQPGGLIVFADVNLGLRWQRAGLLFVQDRASLRAVRLVLGEESFALPESGLLSGRVATAAVHPQRVIEDLVVTGPLQGEARVDDLRIHPDRIEVRMRATYPVPPSPDTGWLTLENGVELRQIDVATQYGTERATVVRLDPGLVRFRVGYDPGNPRRLSDWAAESDPVLAVNGGYYTAENTAIGVVISGGQRWGSTLSDFAGMLAVTQDQTVSVRWLAAWPYDPAEPLQEALQSFPVLVKPGGQMGFPADADDGTPDRRTVVAQDRDSRILVVVAPSGLMSLHDMAVFLTSTDLNLDAALNLDGGASTGMWLSAGEREIRVDSAAPLPVVILVERE